jgi:ankyrin repeat protein
MFLSESDADSKKAQMMQEFVNTKTRDEHEFTPLHFACYNGSAQLIQYLISIGADPCARNKKNLGMIHLAA